MEYVLKQRIERSRRNLVVYPKESLKGKTPFGYPEDGDYWIVSGVITDVRKEWNRSVCISVARESSTTELTIRFPPNIPCGQKAAGLCMGTRITALMRGEEAVDLHLGPYYGKVSWIFHERGCNHAAEEIAVVPPKKK